ncbi:MAG TPA: hypothetical protein VLE99_02560 [Candidatus Saccharimonadales bacterium]|nr:hypothetical protein [Candidatus Saccharimonadales bacterium]
MSSVDEQAEPRVLTTADRPASKKLRLKVTDLVVIAGTVLVCAGLVLFMLHRLALKHEVADAKVVANQVVANMAQQNTNAIRKLGDKKFQADHTAAELDSDLTFKTSPPISFATLYGTAKPTIDVQIVANNDRGQHVVIIYRYDTLKAPFFVRIDTIKPPHDSQWHLQALSANQDESKLVIRTQ